MLIIAYSRNEGFLQRVPFEVKVDPKLVELDRVLDDSELVLMVTNDLLKSAPQAAWNGRPSTSVEVTLRSAVVRSLTTWSYRVMEDEINGSVTWRWFCRIEGHKVPDHSTFRDREALIRPATLHRLNDRVNRIAQDHRLTDGRKMRTDGTVVDTNIHYPTDSSLLSDSVRVIGRLLSRARDICRPHHPAAKKLFRNSSRRARRLALQISHRLRPRNGQKKPKHAAEKPYRELVKLTEATLKQAEQVVVQLQHEGSPTAIALAISLVHYGQLVRRVIHQTVQRVFEHQTVPAGEKIVSLFEPHTAIIRRGRPFPRETEFGRKVWFSEVEGGFISEYRILKGNPPDHQQWKQSLNYHIELFRHPPDLATGDRGIFSPENEQFAQDHGVAHVALPRPGAKDSEREAFESQPWFKAALRFRAGIEGRISGLKRARGLTRCLNRGENGMERWVGWGVITNNLTIIASKLARRRRSVRTAAAA
jgi:IS5 family transposase